jgi:hypothetical protein
VDRGMGCCPVKGRLTRSCSYQAGEIKELLSTSRLFFVGSPSPE